jgi:hypothetical protein
LHRTIRGCRPLSQNFLHNQREILPFGQRTGSGEQTAPRRLNLSRFQPRQVSRAHDCSNRLTFPMDEVSDLLLGCPLDELRETASGFRHVDSFCHFAPPVS